MTPKSPLARRRERAYSQASCFERFACIHDEVLIPKKDVSPSFRSEEKSSVTYGEGGGSSTTTVVVALNSFRSTGISFGVLTEECWVHDQTKGTGGNYPLQNRTYYCTTNYRSNSLYPTHLHFQPEMAKSIIISTGKERCPTLALESNRYDRRRRAVIVHDRIDERRFIVEIDMQDAEKKH